LGSFSQWAIVLSSLPISSLLTPSYLASAEHQVVKERTGTNERNLKVPKHSIETAVVLELASHLGVRDAKFRSHD
jgi:hypothetical protein